LGRLELCQGFTEILKVEVCRLVRMRSQPSRISAGRILDFVPAPPVLGEKVLRKMVKSQAFRFVPRSN
jgi:hypothetical protein